MAVHDGDTVTLQWSGGREKIRLLGIDAPELKQVPWGPRSRDHAASLMLNQPLRVETDVQPRDRYGRLLGYVYVGSRFINRELIGNGHAVLLTYPPNVRHVAEFTAAQTDARARGLGIWNPQEPLDVSPYDFRHAKPRGRLTRGEDLRLNPPTASPAGSGQPGDQVRFNPRSKKFHREDCGHACARCEAMPRAEAEARGGSPCKESR